MTQALGILVARERLQHSLGQLVGKRSQDAVAGTFLERNVVQPAQAGSGVAEVNRKAPAISASSVAIRMAVAS